MKVHEWIDRGLNKRGRNAAAQLARILELDKSAVSRMRRDRRKPTHEELDKIEAFLGEKAPTRRVEDDDPDAKRDRWIARNLLDTPHAMQQKTLNYLAYSTNKIAEELGRIASLLERRELERREQASDTPLGGKAPRNKG